MTLAEPIKATLEEIYGSPVVIAHEEPITTSSGASTKRVVRLTGNVEADGRRVSLIRKSLQPLGDGPHAGSAADEGHWTYWRRELHAYAAGILPRGPELRAPKCLGIVGDDLYLEDVDAPAESARRAAYNLGCWQAGAPTLTFPWLTRDQLRQRIDATALDWRTVDADPRAIELWARRSELTHQLEAVPQVLSHGDFSLGNLIHSDGSTVAIDWATLGLAPVGADLAHLALSSGIDALTDYLEGAGGTWRHEHVRTGFAATIALVGASRVHWMLSRGIDVPSWYVDLIWSVRSVG